VGSDRWIELKPDGKEFKPGAQVGGKGILRKLAFFGGRGDLLQKRILAAAEGLARETLLWERAGEFYEEAKYGRSASHHIQVKAALSLLYKVLSSPSRLPSASPPSLPPRKPSCATTTLPAWDREPCGTQE
jgi:hypothetical protein